MSDAPLKALAAALADRYRIVREIGAGGMATVYLAEDLKHQRSVAVKVLDPQLAASVGAERFLREIRITAGLQHPNILTLIDSGEAAGFLYYVMPFADGISLRKRLRDADGALPLDESLLILREILDALAHAHTQGLVHRDVKPENVMLVGRHALVLDFGVAKAVQSAREGDRASRGGEEGALTSVGMSLGTPAYMAPEQAAGDPDVDHRADLYSAGVVAYELLSGKVPFEGRTHEVLAAHVTKDPTPLQQRAPQLPAALTKLVMRCLAKRPEDRPQHAEAVLAELDALISTSKPVGARVTPRQQIVMLAFGLILVGSIGWAWKQSSDRAWVSSEAIPELQRLVDAENFRAAAILAAKAVKLAPGDTALASLEKRIIEPVSVTTTPSGAEVFERGYSDTAAAWTRLGTTPLAEAMLPRGIKRLRISLAGHDTLESAVQSGALSYTLTLSDTAHAGMVRIPAGTTRAWIAGLDPIEREGLGAYFIDRYEVTNEDFRKFVDAGGYTRRELWKFPITKDGRAIDWQAAVREFVDATGQPGPSTWELGNYAKGQDRHPVSGVSWFEAAAYAEYAGKSLPTVYHWVHAASTSIPQVMIPLSNFSGLGKVAVGRNQGMSAFGVYDMAGNVREWQYNPSGALRHALGGASTDPAYMFTFASTRDPFERSSDLGFRCAKYDGGGSGAAARNLDLSHRDYSKERPVADAVFRVFLNQFSYDQAPLDARVESDSALADYRHQVITFNAAYGGERVIAHLYLPKSGRPPYQTVVYYPGSTAIGEKRFVNDGPMWLAEGGRAVVFPIYKSTYERNDGLTSTWANPTHRHTEAVVRQVKDFKRTVDYLATRSDFDVEKLAYFGNSWGARMGTIIPAVDTRIKTAILAYGGLSSGHSLPEVDQINYAGHITVPVLMLNGRFDAIEPYESAQLPLFRLLGASPVRKRHVVWDVAHGGAPVNAFRKEVLDWLDRYLGTPSR